MANLSQFRSLRGLSPRAANRLIVIDAGSHFIKVLVVERTRNKVVVLRHDLLNLQEEKVLSSEEIGRILQPILDDAGDYPIALALPSQMPLSQILDLSSASEGVAQLIEAETFKNRDLRDSAIVYDCAKLQPFGKHQNSFWVTLCKEADIYQQISRLSLHTEDVYEVVPSANVLALAYKTETSAASDAILVDIGASTTMVTLFIGGQVVHTSTLPIAGNLFTETIASKKGSSIEAAELIKQSKDLFTGPDALPVLANVVDGWRNEIERTIEDWRRENPEVKTPSPFRVVLSGGGALQPGLVSYLNRTPGLQFEIWKMSGAETSPLPPCFAIAYGAAIQSLGLASSTSSVLPAVLRAQWHKLRIQQRFLAATAFFLLLIFFALAFGTWQKLSLVGRKRELLDSTSLALKKAETMENLDDEFIQKYEWIRPVLRRQQQTLDLLNTLAVLEQTRAKRSLWYVLFADQQSYFSGRTSNVTNSPTANGDTSQAKPGFIAELCLKEEGEPMRSTLGQVVSELKQSRLFNSVDTVPVDLRKALANPNVLIPDRHFSLALEVSDTFQFSASTNASATSTNVTGTSISRVWSVTNPQPTF